MSYDLGGGVSCNNCYAFLGAGMLVIFQYQVNALALSGSFDMEAKVGGGLGYSANINAINPTLSAKKIITLISPAKTYQVASLGSSLTFGHKLGGLTATISG